jgi:triphosphoribosyl-dephospho-CoA synthetase
MHHTGDSDVAAQRWRDALARVDYAERHKASEEEVEGLADAVIEAKVAMFQAGLVGGRPLPEFVQAALERDRALLRIPSDPMMPPHSLARGA